MKRSFTICMALLFALQGSYAVSGTVSFDSSNPYNASSLTGFSTFGSDMVGMMVTATFQLGYDTSTTYSSPATWAANGLQSGSASANFGGGSWSLSISGDTFSSYWAVTNNTAGYYLKSIYIDAVPGGAVFDVKQDGEYTPGSGLGAPATANLQGGYDFVGATYSGPVSIANVDSGDMYRFLLINYQGETSPGAYQAGIIAGSYSSILMDTDSLGSPPAVPEPASMLLMGVGAAGMAFMRRRKMKNAN